MLVDHGRPRCPRRCPPLPPPAIAMSESRQQTVGGRRQTCGMERHAAWISVPSPIGDLGVAADAGEITAVHFGGVGRNPIATDDPSAVLNGRGSSSTHTSPAS